MFIHWGLNVFIHRAVKNGWNTTKLRCKWTTGGRTKDKTFAERDKTTKLLNNVKGDFRFSASSEEEGNIRKPQSKDNIAWLSKDSAVRRKQPIPSLQIYCVSSLSFARFCESRISSSIQIVYAECNNYFNPSLKKSLVGLLINLVGWKFFPQSVLTSSATKEHQIWLLVSPMSTRLAF